MIVMTGMVGMLLSGMATFEGLGLAAMVVVFVAMLGSVTVLPALLSLLGDRVELGRIPLPGRRRRLAAQADGARRGGAWDAMMHRVLARPVLFAAASAAILLGLAAALRSSAIRAFAVVMVAAFVLMLASLGSVVIAATCVLLDLLSVGAAYGVMTAVFQHGWGAALVGTHAVGAIESWIPLFLFVILFGLSMDYHVFVVSRIREARDHGMTTAQAVSYGIRSTAGVVTSAAAIMLAVFAVFGTLSMQDFKQLGVGLAAAILLDATLIRVVLLPSVMALLGDRNWYLPKWLAWMPRLTHATPPLPAAAGVPSPAGVPAGPVGPPVPAGSVASSNFYPHGA